MVHLHYVLLSRAIILLAIRAIACYTLNKQDFTYLTFYKTLFIGKKKNLSNFPPFLRDLYDIFNLPITGLEIGTSADCPLRPLNEIIK